MANDSLSHQLAQVSTGSDLTPRQLREIDYHRSVAETALSPLDLNIVRGAERRWWNAYWETYRYLRSHDWRGKKALVLGCGFGNDVILLHHLGATVYGCDLSPEMTDVAGSRCPEAHVKAMPAESLAYPSQYFDLVLCVDILHHCDVPKSLLEIQRVSKPGALLVWSEIYCHSLTFQLRHSRLGEFIWQSLHRWVYGSDRPYITEDERPLSERDIDAIASSLTEVQVDYWDGITGRFWPGRSRRASKLDRGLFSLAGRHIKSLLACRSTGHGVKSAGA